MDEFDLIRRYFFTQPVSRADVVLGSGDDAAVFAVPAGKELVATTDTQLPAVHFPSDLPPEAVGYRALAANLSDLAAMGAEPAWALLALTLPEADEQWLAGFSRGFFALAKQHALSLAGGNVARGPLNITLTALGLVPTGTALKRSGAKAGDVIFVTGYPGDAAAGLKLLQAGNRDMDDPCVRRFCFPEPRIAAGMALRGVASACIDISDGLLADLAHILEASGTGASLEVDKLLLTTRLLQLHGKQVAQEMALSGGDDYELCFTLPAAGVREMEKRFKEIGMLATPIGRVEARPGIRCRDAQGKELKVSVQGYKHF